MSEHRAADEDVHRGVIVITFEVSGEYDGDGMQEVLRAITSRLRPEIRARAYGAIDEGADPFIRLTRDIDHDAAQYYDPAAGRPTT